MSLGEYLLLEADDRRPLLLEQTVQPRIRLNCSLLLKYCGGLMEAALLQVAENRLVTASRNELGTGTKEGEERRALYNVMLGDRYTRIATPCRAPKTRPANGGEGIDRGHVQLLLLLLRQHHSLIGRE